MQTFNYHNIIKKPANQENLEKNYLLNCKTEYAIYLITLYNLEYVHKNQILFNITLNIHMKEEKQPNATILADKLF